MLTQEKLQKRKLKFYPENLQVDVWENVKSELDSLLAFNIQSPDLLIEFLEKKSEFDELIADELAWRYIRMTCDSANEEKQNAYNQFYENIISPMANYDFQLKKKFYDSEFRNSLNNEKYALLNQIIANYIELFREENIPIQEKLTQLENKYGALFGKMNVNFEGEEKTMAQLNVYLKNQDRNIRENAWKAKFERLALEKDSFNTLFDEMKELRIQEAKNAGYDNFRDYMHQKKGRFSYSPQDLYTFHDGVEKAVIPFLKELTEHRKNALKIDSVKPWDTSVDLDGNVLKPFNSSSELIEKSISILNNVDPQFALTLNKMQNSDYLDLENRKGKSPGGYNYPINAVNSSFIFMNSVGLHDDVTTLLHESGHAMHAMAMSSISNAVYKSTPSEIAELASMTMELITMDYWKEFYPNQNDWIKAKKEQLEGTLEFLPWCMTVDAFQHWIYTNPNHSAEQRHEYFASLMDRFNTGIDWSNLQNHKANRWMLQLHIFEVPFYYIEYGMSQLGALAIYKNYKENPQKAIQQYKNFLNAGYSLPVNKLYEIAGVNFKFDEKYLSEIVQFVKNEINALN
jgi:oligoendopeptidase F